MKLNLETPKAFQLDANRQGLRSSASATTSTWPRPPGRGRRQGGVNALLKSSLAVVFLCASAFGQSGFPFIDVRSFGAIGDAVFVNSCAIATGATLLTCTGSDGKGFTSASAGKRIGIMGAGNSDGYRNTLISTIASYVSSNSVILTNAAVNSITAYSALYGTDNCAAFGSATQSSTAVYTGIYGNGLLAGRELYIPGGTYLTTCPLYVRNNMTAIGAGQAGTQIILLSAVNNLNSYTAATVNFNTPEINPVICANGNATAGANTCTDDSQSLGATGSTAVYDLLVDSFASKTVGILATSVGCRTGQNASGIFLVDDWLESYFGIVAFRANIGTARGIVADAGSPYPITLIGDGLADRSSQTYGWLISESHFFATAAWGVWIDGMQDINIDNNSFEANQQAGVVLYSPQGYTTRRLNIVNNLFIAPKSSAAAYHIGLGANCIDCSIVNNKFSNSPTYDIYANNPSPAKPPTPTSLTVLTNLTLSGNTFTSGALQAKPASPYASIYTDVGTTGNMVVRGNVWNSPGVYAISGARSSTVSTDLEENKCFNPFTMYSPSNTSAYQNGCFYLTNNSSITTARNNSTTSSGATKYPTVVFNQPSSLTSSGNSSDYSGCAVCIFSTGSGTVSSFNELATNYGTSGAAAFKPINSAGGFAVGSDAATGARSPLVGHAACIKATGPPVVIGYCTKPVGSDGTCPCN